MRLIGSCYELHRFESANKNLHNERGKKDFQKVNYDFKCVLHTDFFVLCCFIIASSHLLRFMESSLNFLVVVPYELASPCLFQTNAIP